MRRLLSESATYVQDLGRSSLRAWNGFFFTPADPTALGLVRVVVGALLFWNVAVLGLDLREYLGSDGWIGPEAVRQYLAESAPCAWSFWLWVPDAWLGAAWAGCLVVLALFTLGLASRVTAVLAWAIAISTVRRAPVALFGFDQMIATWALYLAAFGASGQALSLDRFLSRYRSLARGRDGQTGVPAASVAANLSLRLIQLHLVLVYGSAGLSKLMGPEWWDGTALEMIILTPEFRRFDLVRLAAFPALLNLATHAGLLLELSYPVLIWVRKLRPLVLVAMALMHLGIDLLLGLTEFGLAMVAANLAFASGPWLRGLVTGARQPSGRLLYRGDSPRCRSLAALLRAADPDGVIEAVDSRTAPAAGESMILVCADGREVAGADALLLAARWLPLFRPAGVLGSLPGVKILSRRALRAFLNDRPDRTARPAAFEETRELVGGRR